MVARIPDEGTVDPPGPEQVPKSQGAVLHPAEHGVPALLLLISQGEIYPLRPARRKVGLRIGQKVRKPQGTGAAYRSGKPRQTKEPVGGQQSRQGVSGQVDRGLRAQSALRTAGRTARSRSARKASPPPPKSSPPLNTFFAGQGERSRFQSGTGQTAREKGASVSAPRASRTFSPRSSPRRRKTGAVSRWPSAGYRICAGPFIFRLLFSGFRR